jgi:DNA-binding beta-propeller fold protein YncE
LDDYPGTAIAVGNDPNHVYLFRGEELYQYDADGNYLDQWVSYDSQFTEDGIFGLAVETRQNGSVWVTDKYTHLIEGFRPNGNQHTLFGGFGNGDQEFNTPTGIAIDSDRMMYLVNEGNFQVQKYNQEHDRLLAWGGQGTADGRFLDPAGIVVDSLGYVYVTDRLNHRVQKFNAHGNFIAKWGTQGTGDGQFNAPWGIAVDLGGNVYVADSGYPDNFGRVQIFSSDGTFLGKIEGTASNRIGNNLLALDNNGNLYVGRAELVGSEWQSYLGKFVQP